MTTDQVIIALTVKKWMAQDPIRYDELSAIYQHDIHTMFKENYLNELLNKSVVLTEFGMAHLQAYFLHPRDKELFNLLLPETQIYLGSNFGYLYKALRKYLQTKIRRIDISGRGYKSTDSLKNLLLHLGTDLEVGEWLTGILDNGDVFIDEDSRVRYEVIT